MVDWNGDGKYDAQDDAYYLLVLDEELNKDSDDSLPRREDSSPGCLTYLLVILFLIHIIIQVFS